MAGVAASVTMGRVTDRLEREERDEHPVAFGLLALVGVAVVVGVHRRAWSRSRARGWPASTAAAAPPAAARSEASLYLPKPEPTRADDGPLITLDPGRQAPKNRDQAALRGAHVLGEAGEGDLAAGRRRTASARCSNIDLTGVYPGGEGAILQVQRFEGGALGRLPGHRSR